MLYSVLSSFQSVCSGLHALRDGFFLSCVKPFLFSSVFSERRLILLNYFRYRYLSAFLSLAERDGSGINEARKFGRTYSFRPFVLPHNAFRDAFFQHLSGQWAISSEEPVILYFHGGVLCETPTDQQFPRFLSTALGARVFSPHYRLAPEHDFSAQCDDALLSYQYLLGQGVEPQKIVVMGHSWGACLALSLLFRLQRRGLPQPACASFLSPCLTESWSQFFSHTPHRKDWLRLEHVRSYYELLGTIPDFSCSALYADLPPFLVQMGSCELFSSSVQDWVRSVSVRMPSLSFFLYPDMTHNFHHLCGLSCSAEQAMVDLRSALGRLIQK